MNGKHALTMMALLGTMAMAAPSAKAADFGFSIAVGEPHPVVYRDNGPRTIRQWVPGRYETQTQQILISPERHEKVWVAPVYRTDRVRGRVVQVVVTPGFYRDVCIPAQYETRLAQVWVPGFYREVAVGPFFDRRDDHHDNRWNDRRDDHRDDRRDDRHDDHRDNDGRPGARPFDNKPAVQVGFGYDSRR
jgi:hypothetical protein